MASTNTSLELSHAHRDMGPIGFLPKSMATAILEVGHLSCIPKSTRHTNTGGMLGSKAQCHA